MVAGLLACGLAYAGGPKAAARQTAVVDAGVLRLRLSVPGATDAESGWALQLRDPDRPRVPGNTDPVHSLPERLAPRITSTDDGYVRVSFALQPGEHVYGLGDKAGPLDRRGRTFTFWNTDAYAWDAARDPLYKAIPFALVVGKDGAYGLLLDDPRRSTFDVGQTDPSRMVVTVEGGAIDVYVIAGPTPRDVLQRYVDLTGHAPLPPKWALGFQQSRYTYVPEARVREVADTLRAHRIPADAIYLDIGFQDANKPFTVDRKLFPNFGKMIGDLRAQGFNTVLITDLHIAKQAGYAPYDSGVAQDVFVKRAGADYVGNVWPGPSVFPDFTLTRVRDWWGELYTDFVRMGAAGFWNDMNEPSVFDVPGGTMPGDVVHRLDDGSTRTHRVLHNAYGMQNARATYEGLLKLRPGERPFVLTRAAFAGTQRYAATWTGDNSASWQHLAQSTPNLLSLGLSGMALAGDDIGGFIGSPPADLLTRWYQLGAWNPVFRSHAATDTRGHEPWVDGPAQEALRRAAIEQRYRLMTYLYTAAEESARTGAPIMRPVWFDDVAAAGSDRDFLFGADLFVAPVVDERVDAHTVQLPRGTWYGLRDGVQHADAKPLVLDPRPADVPVYVRAGAIIPMQPLVQSTSETPKGRLEVHVWWPVGGGPCAGSLYEDDGHTMAYQRGEFLRVRFSCHALDGVMTLEAVNEHAAFVPWWREIVVIVHGPKGGPGKEGARIRDARAGWKVTLRQPG
ncbi:alpha-glucosidase [Lysobacter helvus]|uniref:Alpha-glucosidase n=3 Tax=Lysobacterales TaxID=135614 RepID=A0ABN6FTN8_9GAMM|nr:alpha-glucosidase [Lysobacter caseinilyticus]BCT96246.1 alpha-glucosidase [Lysobacter helvus]